MKKTNSQQKYVITSAQANAKLNHNFMDSLENYCNDNNAELIVLPMIGNSASEDYLEENFNRDIRDKLLYDSKSLNKNVDSYILDSKEEESIEEPPPILQFKKMQGIEDWEYKNSPSKLYLKLQQDGELPPEICKQIIIEVELPKFVDHFRGQGNNSADWMAKFRNWLRKNQEFTKPVNQNKEEPKTIFINDVWKEKIEAQRIALQQQQEQEKLNQLGI
jgi:hypothetical protein